jgi:hypothetical protein
MSDAAGEGRKHLIRQVIGGARQAKTAKWILARLL